MGAPSWAQHPVHVHRQAKRYIDGTGSPREARPGSDRRLGPDDLHNRWHCTSCLHRVEPRAAALVELEHLPDETLNACSSPLLGPLAVVGDMEIGREPVDDDPRESFRRTEVLIPLEQPAAVAEAILAFWATAADGRERLAGRPVSAP